MTLTSRAGATGVPQKVPLRLSVALLAAKNVI
jgi:hypothetical protein